MKRRLNIAISLLHNPEFLILDEPTVGVDPQSRNLIFEALEKLIDQGKTILYTTHYMEEIERLCSRVAIMDHGRIIADDTIEGVLGLMPSGGSIALQLANVPDEKEIEQFPEPIEWRPGTRTLKLRTELQGQEMIKLLDRVERQLGSITEINTERKTLEQVFLHLTGRTLRD
jgi:ABC-2 type transport system ATP-binding protein